MKELGRGTAYNTHNITSLTRTPQAYIRHLADGRSLHGRRVQTHTHTQWLSRFNQNKRKTVAPNITHLMCSLVLLLTISLQPVASCSKCLPYLPVFTSFLCIRFAFAVLQKPCQGNFGKFQEIGKSV